MKFMKLTMLIVVAALICSCSDKGTDDDDDPPCRLEPMVEYDRDADWDPDGSRLLFCGGDPPTETAQWGIFLYSFADGSTTPLLPWVFATGLKFSPDGEWVAFSSSWNIYRISVSGDSLEQLIFSDHDFFPDWSPDGTRIAYHVSTGDDRGIHILDLSTRVDRLVYPYAENPVWSPDGERLAIIGYGFDSGGEIAIIDTSGNLLQQLTHDDSGKRSLDISPDGTRICYTRQFECEMIQLWIMDIDGQNLKKLTTRGGDGPAFSPDGEWIVYTHLGDDNGRLWIMRIDGTEKRQLTSSRDTLAT